MKQWFLVTHRRTKTGVSRSELLSLLPSYDDRSKECPTGEWLYVVKGVLWKNRIRFSAVQGEYKVTDKLYIRWYWTVLLLVSSVGLGLFFPRNSMFDSIGIHASLMLRIFAPTIFLFASIGCWYLIGYVGPLKSFWLQAEGEDKSPSSIVFTLMMVLAGLSWIIDLWGMILAMVCLTAFHWYFEKQLINYLDFKKSNSMTFPGMRPVVTSYLIFIGLNTVSLLSFVVISFFPLLIENWLFLLWCLFCFSVVIPAVSFSNLKKYYRMELNRFDSGGVNHNDLVPRWLFAVSAIVLSTFFGLSVIGFLWRLTVIWGYNEIIATILGLLIGWPLFFIGAGLMYQFTQLIRVIFSWLNGSDTNLGESIDSDVYVLESDELFVGAISVGVYEFILISDSLCDKLEKEELEFVLAHEEGHLDRGDSLLAILTGLVSTLLWTGKNPIYAVLDFETRELEADQYAAEKIGDVEQAVSALESVRELEIDATASSFQNTIPTVVSLKSGSKSKRTLLPDFINYFYGSFAVGMAHRSIDERIDNLVDSN